MSVTALVAGAAVINDAVQMVIVLALGGAAVRAVREIVPLLIEVTIDGVGDLWSALGPADPTVVRQAPASPTAEDVAQERVAA